MESIKPGLKQTIETEVKKIMKTIEPKMKTKQIKILVVNRHGR